MTDISILGTSSMVPTKERNVQAFFIEHKGEGILVDCGEGTQRQLNIMGKSRNKIKKIFITHWHGDHVSGLPGLLHTLSNSDYTEELRLYGPKGTKERFHHIMMAVDLPKNLAINVFELEPTNKVTQFHENEKYVLSYVSMNHSTPCIAFSFVEKDRQRLSQAKAAKVGLKEGPKVGELQKGKMVTIDGKKIKPEDVLYSVKGKKITIIPDTAFNNNAVALAEEADVLISESQYDESYEEKAADYKHMTCTQAARIAQEANVKKLILTHFSPRYKAVEKLVEQASVIFPNVEAAFDMMKVKL